MSNRRNILLIMCDQLRPDFLHAYGADFIPTPNIDALAENGVVFDNAITASTVCAPARMSFLTGEFVSGHGAWTNNVPSREGVEYLLQRLRDAGYMTAATGAYDHYPQSEMFGYHYRKIQIEGCPGCDFTREFLEKHPEEKSIFVADETQHFKYPEEDFYDRWSADCAVEFIESYTKTGKAPDGTAPEQEGAPFFLYCGFFSPHMPLIPPEEVSGTVDPEKVPEVRIQPRADEDIAEVELYRRAFSNPPEVLIDPHVVDEQRKRDRVLYAELIVEIDRLVGRLVRSLKDCGVYDNTTIIFTSDHGSMENDYNLVSKGTYPYKPQLFIPMIIANEPRLHQGSRSDVLCGNLDLGATALNIAGDERAFGVSRSMIGLAEGTVPERRVNLSEFCDSCKTIVDKRYTFTYYPFTGTTCLLDRISDPEETVNLSGKAEYAEVERKFLMDVVDFMVLAKGVRIEAHDMGPSVQAGIAEKNPKYLDKFDIAYPFGSWTEIERLEKAGLDATCNEFCKNREIKAHYGVYFHRERPKQ